METKRGGKARNMEQIDVEDCAESLMWLNWLNVGGEQS